MSGFNNPTRSGSLYVNDKTGDAEITGSIGDLIYPPYKGVVEVTDLNKISNEGDWCSGFVKIAHIYNNEKVYSKFCWVDDVSVQPGTEVYRDTKIGKLGKKNIKYSIVNDYNVKYKVNLSGKIEKPDEKDVKKSTKKDYDTKDYTRSEKEYKPTSDNKYGSDSDEYGKYYAEMPLQLLLSPLSLLSLAGKKGKKQLDKNKIIQHYKRQGYVQGKPRNYIDSSGDMVINLKSKHPEVFSSNYYMHKDLRIEKRRLVNIYQEDGFRKTSSSNVDQNDYILINLKDKHPSIFTDDYFMKKKIPQKSFVDKKRDELERGIDRMKEKGKNIIYGKNEEPPKEEVPDENTTTTTTLPGTVTEEIGRIKNLIESFTKK